MVVQRVIKIISTINKPKKQLNAISDPFSSSFRPKIERLLKDGKIEHLMNTDSHTKADLFYTTHINDLEKELSSVKKSLATMVMKSKTKEYNINILKNDMKKMERETSIIEAQSLRSKNKLESAKDRLKQKEIDLEEEVWKEKSYDNMKKRLIKEQDVLRAKHDYSSVQCANIRDELVILKKKYSQLSQTNKQLKHNSEIAKSINREQTDDKNEFIELLHQQMAQKERLNDFKMDKYQKQTQINDLAGSVIQKEQLLKYMQILFTHKLVDRIIKLKSQKLMKKYERVQEAYMHIKSNTNIVQLDKILKRMESQDSEYQKLLKKVSALEHQIIASEKKIDKLVETEHKTLSMQGVDIKKQLKTYKGIEKDQYQLLILEKEKLTDRRRADEILKKKIMMWVNEYAGYYGIDPKEKEEEDFFDKLSLLATSIKKNR